MIRAFGSPAIVRGTLDIILPVNHPDKDLLDRLAVDLCRFTNFETVQIAFADTRHSAFICVGLHEQHKDTFTSVFEPTLPLVKVCGLKFHRCFQLKLIRIGYPKEKGSTPHTLLCGDACSSN